MKYEEQNDTPCFLIFCKDFFHSLNSELCRIGFRKRTMAVLRKTFKNTENQFSFRPFRLSGPGQGRHPARPGYLHTSPSGARHRLCLSGGGREKGEEEGPPHPVGTHTGHTTQHADIHNRNTDGAAAAGTRTEHATQHTHHQTRTRTARQRLLCGGGGKEGGRRGRRNHRTLSVS